MKMSNNVLFCISCEKEKYYDVTYYKTIGAGYVFMYDINEMGGSYGKN